MSAHRARVVIIVVITALAFLGLLVVGPGVLAPPDEAYDRTTVTFVEQNDTVEVRIADTVHKRYIGLSGTDELERGEGMVFVHDVEAEHTYVMRDMDFPIDIVFIDADCRITSMHQADVPEGFDWWNERYTGLGQYVLEVPMGHMADLAVTAGDLVEIAGYCSPDA